MKIDILKILVIVVLLIAILVPEKKGYKYTSLDKKGIVFNILLSIIYIPMSIAGLFTIFFWDSPITDYSELKRLLLNIVTWVGFSIPLLSIVSIFTSVVARRRGKSKFSFTIQFLPILVFIVMIISMFFMDKA